MKYNRISADCHLDVPWMPPTLFTENSSRELKDRMPYVTEGPDGPMWVTKKGANFGLLNGVGPGGAKLVPGQNKRVDIMAETGLFADGKKGIQRGSDPHLRVKDMERDGVDAEVIFGILGCASKMQDVEAANHMLQIYNDWLVDFCSHYPDRHIGLACIPYGDIDAAVAETHRAAKMGLKGIEVSCSWDMDPMWHPMLGAAVAGGAGSQPAVALPYLPDHGAGSAGDDSGQVRRAAMFTGVSAFQMGLIHILAAMMGAGVFERYPNLRVSFGESGIGWIPYALDRMDFEFEDRFRDLMKLKPSEYWQRQCKATFQYDVVWAEAARREQPDDGRYADVGLGLPAHRRDLAGIRRSISRSSSSGCRAEDIRKITCDNAAKFYNLTN